MLAMWQLPALVLALQALAVQGVAAQQLLAAGSADASSEAALQQMMQLYGSDGRISAKAFRDMLFFGKNSTKLKFINSLSESADENNFNNVTCELYAEAVLNITKGQDVSKSQMKELLPQILFASQNPKCYRYKYSGKSNNQIAWLYAPLSVVVMKIASLSGIATFPCMSQRVYALALSFLVPLAISSLMGSTLFIFIPDTLSLGKIRDYNENFGNPIFKLATIGGGVYMFFLIERLLRLLMEQREKKYYNRPRPRQETYNLEVAAEAAHDNAVRSRKISVTMAGDISAFPKNGAVVNGNAKIKKLSIVTHSAQPQVIEMKADPSANQSEDKEVDKDEENKAPAIPTIAWIVFFGDCIRNFIDGTAIGAAFSLNTFTGLSLTLAFIFEEIPTELGDMAILLSTGLPLRKAIRLHFTAASFSLLGSAVGILLGDLGSSQLWIFSISAGAFFYISLVDLMPEMSHALDGERAAEVGRIKVFVLQNIGLILGFSITGTLGYMSETLHYMFDDGTAAH